VEIVVHSTNSLFQENFQKKWYDFNRHELGFLTEECDVKNDFTGLPESDKKRLLAFLGIRLQRKSSDSLLLRNRGGGKCPPRNFSNFGICTNFQRIKLQFCIQIIFQKSLILIFICPTCKLSPYKIYLETSHLIDNFVNVWYVTTNMLELWQLGREIV